MVPIKLAICIMVFSLNFDFLNGMPSYAQRFNILSNLRSSNNQFNANNMYNGMGNARFYGVENRFNGINNGLQPRSSQNIFNSGSNSFINNENYVRFGGIGNDHIKGNALNNIYTIGSRDSNNKFFAGGRNYQNLNSLNGYANIQNNLNKNEFETMNKGFISGNNGLNINRLNSNQNHLNTAAMLGRTNGFISGDNSPNINNLNSNQNLPNSVFMHSRTNAIISKNNGQNNNGLINTNSGGFSALPNIQNNPDLSIYGIGNAAYNIGYGDINPAGFGSLYGAVIDGPQPASGVSSGYLLQRKKNSNHALSKYRDPYYNSEEEEEFTQQKYRKNSRKSYRQREKVSRENDEYFTLSHTINSSQTSSDGNEDQLGNDGKKMVTSTEKNLIDENK